MKKAIAFVLIVILALNSSACNKKNNNTVSMTNFCFDTVVTISIYNHSKKNDANNIINHCFELCNNYDHNYYIVQNSD